MDRRKLYDNREDMNVLKKVSWCCLFLLGAGFAQEFENDFSKPPPKVVKPEAPSVEMIEKKLAEGTAISSKELLDFYRSEIFRLGETDFHQASANRLVFIRATETQADLKQHRYAVEGSEIEGLAIGAESLLRHASFRLGKKEFDQTDVFMDLIDVIKSEIAPAADQAKVIFKREAEAENEAVLGVIAKLRAAKAAEKAKEATVDGQAGGQP